VKLLVVYAFPFAMAMAAWLDLLTMKIPNRFVLVFAAAFFLAAFAVGMPAQQIAMHIAAGVAMLVVSFLLFIPGWIGGGDAKFFAATAMWLGWQPLFEYALVSSIFGGLLTLGILFARSHPLPAPLARQPWVSRLHDVDTGVPYGIAMAIAGLVIFGDSPWGAAIGL